MKDKIIELNDGQNYYVLDEINHNGNRYICATLCDMKNETVKEDELVVCEVKVANNQLTVNDVDETVEKEIVNIFLQNMKNN